MPTDSDTIVVLGADGYTGWPLVCHLLNRGYYVVGIDNLSRRSRAHPSVTPISSHEERAKAANQHFEGTYRYHEADLTDPDVAFELSWFEPDTVINLAQIPSAPYSMESLYSAWETHENNVRGTLNLLWALRESEYETHLIQLATMGEYGTPDVPIPEGFLDDGRPAPKSPGSFYHASKVNSTVLTRFASETWGLPVTEIYQGIVYGMGEPYTNDERLLTRFDCDSTWGAVLNRFTAQAAVDEPMTVYGAGGQKRAMLSLSDCIQCLTLALENPPSPEGPGAYPYRAINQFDDAYRVREIANLVSEFTGAEIDYIDNPRVEDDSDHFYEPERSVLDELGYEPKKAIEDEIFDTLGIIKRFSDRIQIEELRPKTEWTGEELNRDSVTREV